MSSKRVKRDAINLVSPDRPDPECERLRKEVSHKNEVCPGKNKLTIGDYYIGGVCGQDAKEFVLCCLYGTSLSAVQSYLWPCVLLWGIEDDGG
jgi:hypothetical protein